VTTSRPIRPIDGNALYGFIYDSLHKFQHGGECYWRVMGVYDAINAAPTLTLPPQPEPVADVPGDAISREALLDRIYECNPAGEMGRCSTVKFSKVVNAIQTAPALPCAKPEDPTLNVTGATPSRNNDKEVVMGDAISRSRLLLLSGSASTLAALKAMIERAPSLPCAQPAAGDCDVVGAEDVVEGIILNVQQGRSTTVLTFKAIEQSTKPFTVWCEVNEQYDGRKQVWNQSLQMWQAVAMLNAADSVTYPKGHRLAKPEPGPTLLERIAEVEAIQREIDTAPCWDELARRNGKPLPVEDIQRRAGIVGLKLGLYDGLVKEVKVAIESARGKA
jgi:hypothetical protein